MRRIRLRGTPEEEAKWSVERVLLTPKGEELARLLFGAYRNDKGSELSPLVVTQATNILRDDHLRKQIKKLL